MKNHADVGGRRGLERLCATRRAAGRRQIEAGLQRLHQHRRRFAGASAAYKAVLNVLKQEKQHRQFAAQETVRVMDYQNCIMAVHSGNGQAYDAKCGKLWQEIRDNNN